MNNIVSVLMGTGNKVYLNYGVAEGLNLKLIKFGFLCRIVKFLTFTSLLSNNYEIYKANTLCYAHTFC